MAFEPNLHQIAEDITPYLAQLLPLWFPNYNFRFGVERKQEVSETVILVQYTNLRMFERMKHDPSVEVFIVRNREDVIGLCDKIIARFMLLGLDNV